MLSLETPRDLVTHDSWLASAHTTLYLFTHMIGNSLVFWNHQLCKFTCMRNGLVFSPRILTNILQPPLSHMAQKSHVMFPFIDDSFILAIIVQQCQTTVDNLCETFRKLGFYVHTEKSVFTLKIEN